jgi:integrase
MKATEPVFRRYLTEGEQAKLLKAVREVNTVAAHRDHAWIRLMLSTGMRVGEFARLTVGDLRAARETGWLFIPREHRKGKRRDHQVPVTRGVEEAIEALLALNRPQADERAPAVPSRKHGAAVLGSPLAVRSYQSRMRRWCLAAGIEPASPHWLRHTRAQNIKRHSTSVDPLSIVQGALGHASRASTAIYTAPTKEEVLADLERIDGGARKVGRASLRERWEATHG